MSFSDRVKAFNAMYGLPVGSVPTTAPTVEETLHRLQQFQKMLSKELTEGLDIYEAVFAGKISQHEYLVMLADWLGDIQVYCASEMVRHGLPMDAILNIIMDSNASKLGADGKPIVIEGKVQKGPGYWKPEPKISALLESLK